MTAEVADGAAIRLTEPGEIIQIVLRRVTNGGTNNADKVFGLAVGIHYQSGYNATSNKAPNFYRRG